MTELFEVYLAAWQDPLFLWFPVVTQLVSMGVFLLAAVPMTLVAHRGLLARFRVQTQTVRKWAPRRAGQSSVSEPVSANSTGCM